MLSCGCRSWFSTEGTPRFDSVGAEYCNKTDIEREYEDDDDEYTGHRNELCVTAMLKCVFEQELCVKEMMIAFQLQTIECVRDLLLAAPFWLFKES